MPYVRDESDDAAGRTQEYSDNFHGGKISLSRNMFAYLLQLPDEWRVVSMQVGNFGRDIQLYVEGGDLPLVCEGEDVPELPEVEIRAHTLYNPETRERWFRYEVLKK